jgi:hypothetical protein
MRLKNAALAEALDGRHTDRCGLGTGRSGWAACDLVSASASNASQS